jgi:hypothetical protein
MSAISSSCYDNIRIVRCNPDQAESKIWLTLTLDARTLIREMIDEIGLAEFAQRIGVKESRVRNWRHVREKNNTTCIDIQTARKVNACFKPRVVFTFDVAHFHSFELEERPKQLLREIKSVEFLMKYTGFKRGKINILKSKKRAPETITAQDAATLIQAVKKINRLEGCRYPIPEFEIKLKETDENVSLLEMQTETNPEMHDPGNSSYLRARDQQSLGEMQLTLEDYDCLQLQECKVGDDESKAWFKLTLQARKKIRTMTAPDLALKTGINVNLIKSWRAINSSGIKHAAFIDVQLARKVNECFKPDIVFPLDLLHLHSFEIDSKARKMISKIPIPSIRAHTRFKVSKVSNWRRGYTKNITVKDAIALHHAVKNNLSQYKPPVFVIKLKNLELDATSIHSARVGDKRTPNECIPETDQEQRPTKRIKIFSRQRDKINNQERQHSGRVQTQDRPIQENPLDVQIADNLDKKLFEARMLTPSNVRAQTVSNHLSDEEFFNQLPQIDTETALIFENTFSEFKKFDVQ